MSDEVKQSALEENISRKGNNSYYYAHGKKIDGPQWDGREEPRLLDVLTSSVTEKKRLCIPLESFSWLDETRSVKIFVDFENAIDIPDENVSLVSLLHFSLPIAFNKCLDLISYLLNRM